MLSSTSSRHARAPRAHSLVAVAAFAACMLGSGCGGDDGGPSDDSGLPDDPTAAQVADYLVEQGVDCEYIADDDIDASFPSGDFGACGDDATATGIAVWNDPDEAAEFFADALANGNQQLWAVVDPSGDVWLAPGDPNQPDEQQRLAQELADQLDWTARSLA
jgi:hypothetical protein